MSEEKTKSMVSLQEVLDIVESEALNKTEEIDRWLDQGDWKRVAICSFEHNAIELVKEALKEDLDADRD